MRSLKSPTFDTSLAYGQADGIILQILASEIAAIQGQTFTTHGIHNKMAKPESQLMMMNLTQLVINMATRLLSKSLLQIPGRMGIVLVVDISQITAYRAQVKILAGGNKKKDGAFSVKTHAVFEVCKKQSKWCTLTPGTKEDHEAADVLLQIKPHNSIWGGQGHLKLTQLHRFSSRGVFCLKFP